MKVLVIGGGIGGLATAIGLNQQGIETDVFEAAPEIKAVGAGLWVAPNGMQVLQYLDASLAENIAQQGFTLQEISIKDQRGRVLTTMSTAEIKAKHGFAPICISRSALQQTLAEALKPGQIKTGKKLIDLKQTSEGVAAVFEDGSTAQGDILVGADGIHSRVRACILGPVDLRYAGQTCWRGLCEMRLPTPWFTGAHEIWGAGLRAGFSQMNANTVYFYLTETCSAGGADQSGHLKEMLLDKFKAFPDVVPQIIACTPEEALMRNDLYDFAPIQKYFHERVVLLGDAAHAITPNLGQGANQALESALALSFSLKQLPLGSSPHQAFLVYQALRQPKASWIVVNSFRMGQITNLKHPLLQWLRNTATKYTPSFISRRQFDRIYSRNF